MARTYVKRVCRTFSMYSEPVCKDETFTIVDWNVDPAIILLQHTQGDSIPSDKLISVVYPELHKLNEYEDTTNFRYTVEWQPSNFFDVISAKNLDNVFSGDSGDGTRPSNSSNSSIDERKLQFELKFKNFNQLSSDNNNFEIKFKAYGYRNGVEVFLEERTLGITIQKVSSSNNPSIRTDKSEYYIDYLLNPDGLNTMINGSFNLLFSNFDGADLKNYQLDHYYIDNTTGDEITFFHLFDVTDIDDRLTVNLFSIKGYPIENAVDLEEKLLNLSVVFYLHQDGEIITTAPPARFNIDIHYPSTTDFYVDTQKREYELKRTDDLQVTDEITIDNPHNLTISVEPSTILSTEIIESGTTVKVRFTSLSALELLPGENQASILLYSDECRAVIPIEIKVVDYLSFPINSNDIIFCEDEIPLIIRKSDPNAEYIALTVDMKFVGYNNHEYNLSEIYEYVFFNDQIKAYPGEDINDFFEDIRSLENFNINETSIIAAKRIFKTAVVTLTAIEKDFAGNTYETHILEDLKFLPGHKPKAFPYLTNCRVRSTYSDSLISLSAVARDLKSKNLGEIASYFTDNTLLTDDFDIGNISFRRSVADTIFGKFEIVKKETLKLEPKPNTRDVIDVIFQNQNHCPDWFSFSGEYQQKPTLTHTIADNAIRGNEFKAAVDSQEVLLLNTGWIFKEEVELLKELVASKLCFIKIDGKWITAIPISKNPLPQSSERNVNSQILEFKIIDNER